MAKTKSDRYSLPQSDKGLLEAECSAGEGSCIYIITTGNSACVDAMIIVNCEGTNKNDSPFAAGSTFHH
jgi:hypothetical protein